ncbi:MAG TPA: polyprenyl synthetase family protein [Thermoanaerobaculia bacterium]|nr:polyprenyl synthetase family protein [Thermoanaerobaculia bacterium]
MNFEKMKRQVREVSQIASWPQMCGLVERTVHRESSVWEYPVAACRAVGGSEEQALPAAAATFCSVISIHLVDDMLDEDPRGDYLVLGSGQVANYALAFQAAGHLLLDAPGIPLEIRPALHASFAGMSLATCFGQGLDARELQSEGEYWQVVESKTPPLFSEALRMGALLGGASAGTADLLARLGRVLGRLIQVSDDVTDALETPARADWKRRGNNLPILYAMTAGHPEREEFLDVSTQVEDPEALARAQKILLRSGAVSYCTLKLVEFSKEAQNLFESIPLQDREPVARLVELHLQPLHRLLESVGVEEPALLFS